VEPTLRHRGQNEASAKESAIVPLPAERQIDRFDCVWRAKWVILAIGVVVSVATYLVSGALPPTFQASSLVQVTAINNGTTSQADTVTASSSLAAQYAQYASSGPVVAAAVRQLGPTSSASLSSRISAATVADQNLIRVSVQADTGAASQQAANAVASALNAYIGDHGDAAVQSYSSSLQAQLKSLDSSIASTQAAVTEDSARASRGLPGSAAVTTLNTQQTLLGELLIRRETLSSQAASAEVSLRPLSSVVGSASLGTQIQPNPKLYSIVALFVGLMAAAEIAILLGRRRNTGRLAPQLDQR